MSKPVILVTGASKGIGLAVTRWLLNKFSANVIAFQRSLTSELEQLQAEHQENLRICQGDVTSNQDITGAIQTAISEYGKLTGLILNAGTLGPISQISNTEHNTLDKWRSTFEVNVFSLIEILQLALPELKKGGGRVVFVSSGAAVGAVAGWGAYSASKAAMNSICRTLANEEKDVTFVSLRPGMVDTEMQASLRRDGPGHMLPNELTRFTKSYEEGTLVKPEDCGHVIAALAVSATSDLSGQFINWDSPEMASYRKS